MERIDENIGIEEQPEAEYYAALEELATDPVALIQEAIAYLENAKLYCWNHAIKPVEDNIKQAESYLNEAVKIIIKKENR